MKKDNNKKSKTKKIVLIVLVFLVVLVGILEISYAYWLVRVTQKSSNIINSGCLNITLADKSDAINLEDAYPISDEAAESLTPYEFTIANTCSSSVDYDVTLEIMGDTSRLSSEYVAINFNDTGKQLLTSYTSVDPTYSDEDYTAVEARELISGTLEGKDEITYTIKLWIDQDVTSLDSMDKIFTSKISVTAGQKKATTSTDSSAVSYIETLAESDTTNIVTDDTDDANIRFIGADPDNYLCFDEDCTNGKWRVIGVMNNMTTADGVTKSLVKIIRNESIDSLAWDSNNVNDWTTASLNTYLNGDWYTSNLADYDSLLESIAWNLGGYSSSAITTSTFYAYERNTIVYSGSPSEWIGKIALMYPSDYGYATSGGDTGRDTCLTYNLSSWHSYSNCYGNDYLYLGSLEWTLMPYSSNSNFAFYVSGSGLVNYRYVSDSYAVRPVGYLKSNTQILSGEGTSDSPWIIGVN